MSRSPTTPDKRVGHADSRPASGFARYKRSEGNLGNRPRQDEEPQASAVAGTGPNPNLSGRDMRPVYDVYADRHTGGWGDNGGFSQDGSDFQTLDGVHPAAPKGSG